MAYDAEEARIWWEGQLLDWEREDQMFPDAASPEADDEYVNYMQEVIECPCGLTAPRYKMEEHWCDDLEEIVNAVHTTKK